MLVLWLFPACCDGFAISSNKSSISSSGLLLSLQSMRGGWEPAFISARLHSPTSRTDLNSWLWSCSSKSTDEATSSSPNGAKCFSISSLHVG
ncbi:uncharacterized protein BDV17DRAFT_160499 [Aspergillus undulatus]|uniref:uncharacterized protein n=1 Tax=Aspergillus undulatus TaxID=1810928 RepID=UPI003CCCAD7E